MLKFCIILYQNRNFSKYKNKLFRKLSFDLETQITKTQRCDISQLDETIKRSCIQEPNIFYPYFATQYCSFSHSASHVIRCKTVVKPIIILTHSPTQCHIYIQNSLIYISNPCCTLNLMIELYNSTIISCTHTQFPYRSTLQQ